MIDKKNLYQLPWNNDNNPNGWIEPTTYCQLKCPGCYRGLAEKNPERYHQNIKEVKKEIDLLIEKRNIQTLSIAGGEPLLYPNLKKVIEYAVSKSLKTRIFTNGVSLNEEKLIELKKAGATEFVIHIDKSQNRFKADNEIKLNKLREGYCKLFRKIKGVNLGFIMPLSKDNLPDLKDLVPFYQKNSDIINLIVFTVRKEILPSKELEDKYKIETQDLFEAVQNEFGLNYCSYLGKKLTKDISWLFAVSLYSNGKILGSFNKSIYKFLQNRYYKRKNKYFITINRKPVLFKSLLQLSFNMSILRIIKNFLLLKNRNKINSQVVLIINPPDNVKNKWDLCDGCPDAMIYKNKLVPSCLLERIKKGEKILVE